MFLGSLFGVVPVGDLLHEKGVVWPWKSDGMKIEKTLPRFCVKVGVADRC